MTDRLHTSISNSALPPQDSAVEAMTELYAGDDAASKGLHGEERRQIPDLSSALEATFPEMARHSAQAALEMAMAPPPAARPVGDTTIYPFRAIAFLEITARDGTQWRGTGFFVSPRTLVTAGHNVFLRGGWAHEIIVHPGRNISGGPFGAFRTNAFSTVEGWARAADPSYDYGSILLDEPIGNTLGYFGIREATNTELAAGTLSLAGYPLPNGEMWEGIGGAAASANPLRVFYNVPTAEGQSGSAVILDRHPAVVAVHGYDTGALNAGVRVGSAVHQQILSWRR